MPPGQAFGIASVIVLAVFGVVYIVWRSTATDKRAVRVVEPVPLLGLQARETGSGGSAATGLEHHDLEEGDEHPRDDARAARAVPDYSKAVARQRPTSIIARLIRHFNRDRFEIPRVR